LVIAEDGTEGVGKSFFNRVNKSCCIGTEVRLKNGGGLSYNTTAL